MPHPRALLHPLSSLPGFTEPRVSGGPGDAVGTHPNSLSVGARGRHSQVGAAGSAGDLSGQGLAGSPSPAAFISLGLLTPLLPGAWEGTGRDADNPEGGEGSASL